MLFELCVDLAKQSHFYEIVEKEIIFASMLFLPSILETAYCRNFSLPNAHSECLKNYKYNENEGLCVKGK